MTPEASLLAEIVLCIFAYMLFMVFSIVGLYYIEEEKKITQVTNEWSEKVFNIALFFSPFIFLFIVLMYLPIRYMVRKL